ncbi:MAG: thioredoxin family protein [Oscillospiraceae bacterium]|nr:thioredoxin family protein [Oscillospiraceae bacterium]MDD7294134.1 thioredoxin domain-containing protein [Oscillospiraceae bacterium]MDY2509659.1 thioredoxin domain-containing protein [Ruminococcus callidus]
MAVRVSAENFAAEVLQADGIVLVDFYSDSCVPCKRIAPLLSEVAAAYPEGFKVVKVNINFDADLAEQYAVQAAPTLVFFQNGTEQARLRGLVKKSEIVEIIDTLKK